MKRLIWVWIVVFVASSAAAQSLAEIAKKEKERRKNLESSDSKTVTDVELRRAGGPRTLSSTRSSTSDSDADDGSTEGDTAEDDQAPVDERQDEAYWRGRLAPVNERIQSMEERLNSPQFTSNPLGASDRMRLERDLASARADRQAILDEARRKGAPPGWLR